MQTDEATLRKTVAKNIAQYRKAHHDTQLDLATKLNYSDKSVSKWERGESLPDVYILSQIAELYGVSVDFLLGLPEARYHRADMLQPIPPEALPAFHDTPVFSSRYGWAMVNAIEGELLFASGMRLSLADAAEVYVLPPAFATLGAAVSMPLRRDELTGYDCVWVEPISMDAALRDELRGWYHIKRRFAENEVGQRFYFDFYGAKWLAFANGPGNI